MTGKEDTEYAIMHLWSDIAGQPPDAPVTVMAEHVRLALAEIETTRAALAVERLHTCTLARKLDMAQERINWFEGKVEPDGE